MRQFTNPSDVYNWFFLNTRTANASKNSAWGDILRKGIMIDTKLRREILTSEYQGNLPCGKPLIFKNLGGGVWNASIDYPTCTND